MHSLIRVGEYFLTDFVEPTITRAKAGLGRGRKQIYVTEKFLAARWYPSSATEFLAVKWEQMYNSEHAVPDP
jgi:hypothetical protein